MLFAPEHSGGKATKKRHKCLEERLKPISEQHGAVQCPKWEKWFKGKGGSIQMYIDPITTQQYMIVIRQFHNRTGQDIYIGTYMLDVQAYVHICTQKYMYIPIRNYYKLSSFACDFS